MLRAPHSAHLIGVGALVALAAGGMACGTGGAGASAAPTAPAAFVPSPAPPVAVPGAASARAPSGGDGPATRIPFSVAELDRQIAQLWEAGHVTPAGVSDDAEFLRRVTLDVAGRVPTVDEAERFLADRSPDKRARLVDGLLGGADFADHFADLYMDLFIGRQFRKPKLEKKLDPRGYFAAAFAENRSFDRIARELLTFTGEMLPNGPGVFLASHLKGGGPEMAASATARLFMGVQIQCAQCHDHPYDRRYKQEDFYGLVAYFARTKSPEQKADSPRVEALRAAASGKSKNRVEPLVNTNVTLRLNPRMNLAVTEGDADGDMDARGSGAGMAGTANAFDATARGRLYFVIDRPKGQAKFKKNGADKETVVAPRFLGRDVPARPGESLRETLARAVVESDLFAKTVVDRTWAELFGRGIVDPWDDLGGEHDPNHPALLTWLGDRFRASGFDFRGLVRTLVLSRAYGLTSRVPEPSPPLAVGAVTVAAGASGEPTQTPADPTKLFARAAVRRLTPEQIFKSLLVATGAERMERKGVEDMTKKIERLLRETLFVFGDDEMAEVDTFNGNIPQALLMWNGEISNMGARAHPGGTLAGILDGTPDPAARLRKMYLAAFARPPTAGEQARLLSTLAADKAGRAGYEDVFFALLTSSEMLTNH